MKLTVLFLLTGIGAVFAVNSYSQTTRLSLKLNNGTIREAFSRIEKQSEYIFFYYDNILDVNKKVSVDVENQTVDKILDEVLKTTGSTYTISDRQIYITKSNEPVSITQQKPAKKITGVVKDVANTELPGVTVQIKGTAIAYITDADGKFELKIPDVISSPVLVFKYIGFQEREVDPNGQTEISVTMEEKPSDLKEVVVVGYGTQKKESVVGSVQTVRPNELRVPSSSLSTSFAGRLAGVIAVQRTGEPGADGANFWIRGVATTSGATSPLIIIDGVEGSSGDLNSYSPEMIESFSVLKDATATALYGSRGANGVLIITTKSGVTEGKAIINLRIEENVKQPLKTPNTVGGAQYMQLYNEAYWYRRAGGTPYTDEKIQGTLAHADPYVFPDVDWYDEMFNNTSYATNVNLNIRGGGPKADYYMGANVSSESGMLKNLSKDFYSYDGNIDVKNYVFQNNATVRLTPSSTISLKLHAQLKDTKGPNRGTGDVFNDIMRSNPVAYPVLWPAGDPRQISGLAPEHIMWGGIQSDGYVNPVAEMTNGYKTSFESTVMAQLSFKQKLDFVLPGLSANALLSFKNWTSSTTTRSFSAYNRYSLTGYTLNPQTWTVEDYEIHAEGNTTTPVLSTSGANAGDRTIYIQAQLDYNRTFNKLHNVQGMLVYNQSEYNNNVPGSDLLVNLPKRTQSIAGRVSYAFDNKYLAEANFGYNGSEGFAKGHRFGFFPAVAVGYNISQEEFWTPLKNTVSNLKARASWGKVGNDKGADRFMYLSSLALQDRAYRTGVEQDYEISGPRYNRYANPALTWEVGTKINVGLDVGLFNDINIMFDVFREKRENIFGERGTIPAFLGTANTKIYGNLVEVENKGMDFALNYDKEINKDWFLSVRGTFTFARNKVLELDEPDYLLYPNKTRVGHQINQWSLLLAERLFIDQAEIDNSPRQSYSIVKPGDIKYTDIPDVNGEYNGIIDDNDKVYTGYPTNPELIYGFGASAKYRKFDASFFMQGQARVSLLMENFHPFGTTGTRNNYNVLDWVAEARWNPDDQDPYAKYPALSLDQFNNTTVGSTFWLRDASFLKLKTVEIGYSDKFYRIYVSGNNLLTFSPFKYWDPEQGGGSGYKYPNQRVFNVGVQMNF
ncbi:MAG: TonB-dependent receptor [Prevotella sp.]|nr:TonB-dependent receptor [Prevotella sp.]